MDQHRSNNSSFNPNRFRSLLISPRTPPLHFRPSPVTSLQLTPYTLGLIPWSCSFSPRYPSCSLRGLSSMSPRASYLARHIALHRRLAPRGRRTRRLTPPQLDVFICIEENLPDDPQIQVTSCFFHFVYLQLQLVVSIVLMNGSNLPFSTKML